MIIHLANVPAGKVRANDVFDQHIGIMCGGAGCRKAGPSHSVRCQRVNPHLRSQSPLGWLVFGNMISFKSYTVSDVRAIVRPPYADLPLRGMVACVGAWS